MHPRAVAGARSDERELPLAHEFDLVVSGTRPVEPVVSEGCTSRLHDHVLEVQWVFLGLHPSTRADSVPVGIALRGEVGHIARLGRGQQMVRPLSAEPVGYWRTNDPDA